jgi:hypothetical protein
MRFQKSAPLFALAALMMALAIGCTPAAEQAEEPAATTDHSEMGHDDAMAPDTTMMSDTLSSTPEGEGSGTGN